MMMAARSGFRSAWVPGYMGVTFAYPRIPPPGTVRAVPSRLVNTTQFGEGSAGSGAEAAHTSTVLGLRGGAIEAAWASALATPSKGYPRLVVNVRPGLPVQPLTVLVPKLEVVT